MAMVSCASFSRENDMHSMSPRARSALFALLALGLLLRLLLAWAPFSYLAGRGSLVDDAFYSFGIARNLVWKSARRERFFGAIGDEQELPETSLADLANELVRKEQAIWVRHAVLSLPRKYREVIVLCSLQDLSYEQAATVIGSSIGTVRSRMHRAKQLLLRKLKERGLAPEAPVDSSVLRCGI